MLVFLLERCSASSYGTSPDDVTHFSSVYGLQRSSFISAVTLEGIASRTASTEVQVLEEKSPHKFFEPYL
jgi:hypothetical protein